MRFLTAGESMGRRFHGRRHEYSRRHARGYAVVDIMVDVETIRWELAALIDPEESP